MGWRGLAPALLTWAMAAAPALAQQVWGFASGDVLILVAGDAEEAEAFSPARLPRLARWSQPVGSFLDGSVSPITGLPAPGCAIAIDQIALEPDVAVAPSWWQKCQAGFDEHLESVCLDFKHMYTGKNLCCLAAAIAVAAPLANTSADQDIRDWYQREVVSNRDYWHRKRTVNEFFDIAGDWQVMVPVYLGSWALGTVFDDNQVCYTAGQWSHRTLRALLVGSVASGTLQFGLGAGRPGEGSHWRPFHDTNSVAGHGFVGAVPFLTAASMTRCKPLRWTLVAASFGTTWTRLDRDAHYFSQCVLGWSIAYLATQSVNMTELELRNVQLIPIELPQGGAGAGVMIRY